MLANDATSGKKKTNRMPGNNPGYKGFFFLTFVHQKIEKENTCLHPPLLSLDPREKGMRKLDLSKLTNFKTSWNQQSTTRHMLS
jgi:hypothetical protein